MSKKHWSDQLNEEYDAATTDKERLVVLEQYMSHDSALDALKSLEHGVGGIRPASKPDGRPDEGREDSEPDTGDDA